MIPILIEPTCLAFKLAVSNKDFSDSNNELLEFKNFIKELQDLFKGLEENRLKIAITKELRDIYLSSIPISVYDAKHPIHKLAIEVYTSKLMNSVKVVHKFGAHSLEIDFDNASVIKNNEIYNSDTYLHWRDMSGLIFENKLTAAILKSKRQTIYRGNTAFICNLSRSLKREVFIYDKLLDLKNSREIKLQRLSNYIRSVIPLDNIPCSGTGTHSSMWNKSIREINDVPNFERELLKKLMDTGIVKSIKFLAFEKKLDSVESPLIVVNRVEEKSNTVLLMCTLRGQGVKQHCQDIVIEVVKDFAYELVSALDYEISIDKLDNLFSFNAAISAE